MKTSIPFDTCNLSDRKSIFKGISVTDIAFEHSKKYVAFLKAMILIDAYKSKQFDFMEAHPEYSLCVHAAYRTLPTEKLKVPHETR